MMKPVTKKGRWLEAITALPRCLSSRLQNTPRDSHHNHESTFKFKFSSQMISMNHIGLPRYRLGEILDRDGKRIIFSFRPFSQSALLRYEHRNRACQYAEYRYRLHSSSIHDYKKSI